VREAGRFVCSQGHSFDIAGSGYLNLLQPQDRRSKQPGDSRAAVQARRKIHELGVTAPLLEAIAEFLEASASDTVLDVGSGEGFYLGELAGKAKFQGHGIDISVPAVDAAAKRYPEQEWIVANADRFIPYADGSFSKVLSLTARLIRDDFQRVLQPEGLLLIALPAPDDLIELRGTGRDRMERTVQMFAPNFAMVRHHRATVSASLDAEAVANVLLSIYRPMQSKPPEAGRITFSLDLLLFRNTRRTATGLTSLP
jgi:23S rRNA (guanine745-N1)-methyltransferase